MLTIWEAYKQSQIDYYRKHKEDDPRCRPIASDGQPSPAAESSPK